MRGVEATKGEFLMSFLRAWVLVVFSCFVVCGCGDSASAPGLGPSDTGEPRPGNEPGTASGRSVVMPLPTRGIPDPVLHEVPAEPPLPGSASIVAKDGGFGGGAGAGATFGGRVEQCMQQGGTLADCSGTAGLCLARDLAMGQIGGELFDKLGLGDLGQNYYCDDGCYHCCWVPGGGLGGAGGGCHTSFDTSEGPRINCNPGIYGAGTVGVGPALIIGDSIGLGICIGGVQQLCNHMPVCNGASSSAGPGGGDGGDDGASTKSRTAKSLTAKGLSTKSTSEPPHESMSNPQTVYLHVQSFENAMRRNFFGALNETPARERRKDYVDFITARGASNWMRVLREVEPYNRRYDAFSVTDDYDEVLPAASYHQGLVFHANLAFVGAVPNLIDRLAYVEARYWTEEEKAEYLEGIDPEAELRKTMSPRVFEALKGVPIQDWRLLARPAPNEPAMDHRRYDGFRLGTPPIVTAVQDCVGDKAVSLALGIDDPEEANQDGFPYPVVIDWGDGFVSRHTYDVSSDSNVYTHDYDEAGTYLAYVTTANSTGLRGVVGVVVDAEQGDADPDALPAIATVELDEVVAYAPSVSLSGDLSFAIEAQRSPGATEGIGWSDVHTLVNAGPNELGDIVGYNETLTPVEKIIIRPFHWGGHWLNSVYFKARSITLGLHDRAVGSIATHTIPLTAEMVRVYYDGATEPVPAEWLERDLNGDLLLPVDRPNDALPSDFCGFDACEKVDRIEIDLRSDMLDARPRGSASLRGGLIAGDTARWVEDIPNVFIPAPAPSIEEVPGDCTTTLEPALVTAGDPADSFVASLDIESANAVVTGGSATSLRAVATLLDGTTLDVTQQVTWGSLDETVLRVSNGDDKGELSPGTIPGEATITATLGGVLAEATAIHDSPARGYASYRIHFDAVHGSRGKAAISGVDFIVDGRILESRMESEDTGTIGPFPAMVGSSEGSDPTYAFDVSGSAWSSAVDSFSTEDPYEVGESPVYLQVDFESSVPVEGLRLHRTAGILFASYGPWFPKQVRVQGSNDGATYEDIDGAATTLVDWRGEPAVMEWDLVQTP